jgi:hypothetical protein
MNLLLQAGANVNGQVSMLYIFFSVSDGGAK